MDRRRVLTAPDEPKRQALNCDILLLLVQTTLITDCMYYSNIVVVMGYHQLW